MKKGHTKTTRRKSLWVTIVVALVTELLAYGWCRVQCVKVGYEIASAHNRHARLEAISNELGIEKARLRSPKVVRQAAVKRGLTMPQPEQILMMP